jgi:hypothetical protein
MPYLIHTEMPVQKIQKLVTLTNYMDDGKLCTHSGHTWTTPHT